MDGWPEAGVLMVYTVHDAEGRPLRGPRLGGLVTVLVRAERPAGHEHPAGAWAVVTLGSWDGRPVSGREWVPDPRYLRAPRPEEMPPAWDKPRAALELLP